jgi:RNA-directed DNA polymerase
LLLDELDKELEKRGHRFARYADDANIYVRRQQAGERVMASVRRFLERTLRLKVNEAKSAVETDRGTASSSASRAPGANRTGVR